MCLTVTVLTAHRKLAMLENSAMPAWQAREGMGA